MNRCGWDEGNELNTKYHDEEWCVPVHDDRVLFEFIVLESMQAGLSWLTILKKRENFREAFDQFDPTLIANYNEQKIEILLDNKGIIRYRKKIEATINNAQQFLDIQKEFGSFDTYLWRFVDNEPIVNHPKELSDIPVKTELSDRISADLKKRGFKFLGSTTLYAYLQAVGVVNDHLESCSFKYK